jgi:hypothetical protein
MAAMAFDPTTASNPATSTTNEANDNAQIKIASLGSVQPNDDSYLAESVGKCGARQASGGQKGDRRTIKFPARTGKKTIQIGYDMLRIPDQLQIIHKGKVILDTGFVSGSKVRSLSFNQSPKELTVILRGNPTQSGTVWTYIVGCPK